MFAIEAALAMMIAAAGEPRVPDHDPAKEIVPRRPGPGKPLEYVPPLPDPSQVPGPAPALPRESLPVEDRWRIMRSLGVNAPWYDPYNPNVLKGDLPIAGEPWFRERFPRLAQRLAPDWFVNLGVVSDTLLEARRLPTPVGPQATARPDSVNVYGGESQTVATETLIVSMALIKGDTTFRPPDYELRLTPALNVNHARVDEVRALRVDPRSGTTRDDNHAGLQEAFADVHLRNVSARYDFDSVRVGIQPFTADFRGFLFNDVPLGVRLFGTRDNNQWQYNLAWLRRLEKDTNSGLNDVGRQPRRDDVFVANAYRQDWPRPGFTSQAIAALNVNREGGAQFYDANGFLVRPAVQGDSRGHDYTVAYLGYNGDGHLGRWNLSASAYAALGRDDRHPLAQRPQSIRAGFAAAELSRDFSWVRLRMSALFQSGDRDPFDGKATGFDAILENPLFAGADTSYWIRQPIPLIGGGGVALSGRNGVLADLRASKDQGQSNFVNPGLMLAGIGGDVDLTPQTRLIGNLSYLRFAATEVLGVLRNQAPPPREIGWDVSGAVQWRPFMSQNVVVNASAAALFAGSGLKALYPDERVRYSMLVNVVAAF
ncbi:MAG TPA: hypothetical protein VFP44_22505 [Usitatibacter sp.]|nr:hypothetical protein [Usitatibacter sp.]